jgi:hypothetical protein
MMIKLPDEPWKENYYYTNFICTTCVFMKKHLFYVLCTRSWKLQEMDEILYIIQSKPVQEVTAVIKIIYSAKDVTNFSVGWISFEENLFN